MTLPLTTTTLTIKRVPANIDPYADTTPTVVTLNVFGAISGSNGTGSDVGGAQQVLTARLFVESDVDVRIADVVIDETSNEEWRVLWVRKRYELGLGHTVAGLEYVAGHVV